MREYVMVDGAQLPAENLDRGPVLLRPEDEWASDYDGYTRGRMQFEAVSLVILTVLVFLLVMTSFAVIGIMLAAIIVLAALAGRASYVAMHQDLLRGGAVPGAYTLGVELPMYPVYTSRLFIPYSEMEDAWVSRSRMGDDVLLISVAGSRWRWRFPGRLLGEDGMAAVVERARTGSGIEMPDLPEGTPPRLVIYTAGGASPPRPPEGS